MMVQMTIELKGNQPSFIFLIESDKPYDDCRFLLITRSKQGFSVFMVHPGEAVKLDVAMASLTKWAEEPNPCIGGDSRQALLAAGSLVRNRINL
jgi:hypothetical protein